MTYEEIYNQALQKLCLYTGDVEDYRPAVPMHIEQLKEPIPNGIIIWLKNGDKLIYVADSQKEANKELTRREAETVFARYLMGEKVQDAVLKRAIPIAVRDMHTMTEIESVCEVKMEMTNCERCCFYEHCTKTGRCENKECIYGRKVKKEQDEDVD